MTLTTTDDVHSVLTTDWNLSKMYTHLLLYKSSQHTYNNYKQFNFFFEKYRLVINI